jgi:hypothetical protein
MATLPAIACAATAAAGWLLMLLYAQHHIL